MRQQVYDAICKNLQEFGYPSCTPDLIKDTHEAMQRGDSLPHGVIGAFAESQIEDAIERKLLEQLDPKP